MSANWDFFPTFAEIARAEVPEGLDGISMVSALTAEGEQPQHEFLYWEFHEGKASKQAVRMGLWKGVRLTPSAPLELYHLSADIGEKNNVAAANPDIVKKIEDYLQGARTESELWPLRGE